MSYLVKNITNRMVIISDLRVEIPPTRQGTPFFDLESVARLDDIRASRDLKHAFDKHYLQRVSRAKVKLRAFPQEPKPHPKYSRKHPSPKQDVTFVQNQTFDEDKFADLLRKVIREEVKKESTALPTNKMDELMDALHKKLNSAGGIPSSNDPSIDGEALANLQKETLQKISDEIETGGGDSTKKVKIKSKDKFIDRANELD